MNYNKYIVIFITLNFVVNICYSQTTVITNKVIDAKTNSPLYYALVIKKKTSTGIATNNDGQFEIKADDNDTLLITSYGYKLQRIAVSDLNTKYKNGILMYPLVYDLKPVTIIPDYTLNEVSKKMNSIQTPNYDRFRDKTSTLNALNSPISFLYYAFSKLEKSKRLVEQLTNDDNRMLLYRGLFKVYMFDDFAKLNSNQIDDFIKYTGINEEMIKASTEYELAVFIKKKYESYANQNDYVRPY